MEIRENRLKEIARLLDEIGREVRGKGRAVRIADLARRAKLEIKRQEREWRTGMILPL